MANSRRQGWPGRAALASAAVALLAQTWACGRSPLLAPRTTGSADAAPAPLADAAPDLQPDTASDLQPDASPDLQPDTASDLQPDIAPPRPRKWQGPEPIEAFSNHSYSTRVVMDPQGHVTAAWRQYGVPRGEAVAANRFDRRASAWGQARTIDDGKNATKVPDLATDGAGNVIAVWEQPRTFVPPQAVYGVRFDIALGDWQQPGLIADTNSDGMLDPIVGLGADGDGLVVWLQSKSGHSLHAARFVSGAWQPAVELLREGSGNPGYPSLAVDRAGNATLMRSEIDGPRPGLYLRRMDASTGVWSDDVALSAEPCYSPTLAVAPSGRAAATWTQPGGANTRLHVAHTDAQGDWKEEEVPDAGPGNPIYPSLAVSDSLVLLVWRQGEAQGDVLSSRLGDNGFWQPVLLVGRDAGANTWPRATIDAKGEAIVTWQQGTEGAYHVVAARYNPVFDWWSMPVMLDNGAGNAATPVIAGNASGLAVVIWEQPEPGLGSSHLWANRWE